MRTVAALQRRPEAEFGPVAAPAPGANRKSLLRFITCGSVDDGKSTLLGRLLWETHSVFEDQAEALANDSRRFGTTGDTPDLALLVDGLAAEREQGITIDVAYRYFGTANRAFIAADTPGHEQYTRNMATGASTADCAVILIDARKGLLAQTRRHSCIVSMIGVRDVIIAINKMDLVGYDEATFRRIEADYRALIPGLGFTTVHFVPLSAREGDNVAKASAMMPWYSGPSLLTLLETIETSTGEDAKFRMPIQWVNRPNAEFRGFSGTIASGEICPGDSIVALPSGRTSRIARILTPSGDAQSAGAGAAVTLTLADEIDISRGDVLVASGQATRRVTARLLALSETAVVPGKPYLIKLGTAVTGARLVALHHAIDVHDYTERPAAELAMNALGLATLHIETPIYATRYADCRTLGSLLLIDPLTNEAVALGTVEHTAADAGDKKTVQARAGATAFGRIALAAGLIVPGASRDEVMHRISWRIASALLFLGLALAVTGSVTIALGAGFADLVLRPALRVLHDRLWQLGLATRHRPVPPALGIDGGGI